MSITLTFYAIHNYLSKGDSFSFSFNNSGVTVFCPFLFTFIDRIGVVNGDWGIRELGLLYHYLMV